MPTAEEIQKRLTPTHLMREEPAPVEDLKRQAEEAAKPEEQEKQKRLDDPRGQKQYSFTLDYKSPTGKIWTGKFTNKILNVGERQMAGALRARLSGGVPLSALDDLTDELNLMLSHLTYSLVEKPDWAENLRELEDFRVLQEIYEEVASHEAFFLGFGSNQGTS